MFELNKKLPFKLKFTFGMREEPVPINEQKKYMSAERQNLKVLIDKSFKNLLNYPYEVRTERKIKEKLKT